MFKQTRNSLLNLKEVLLFECQRNILNRNCRIAMKYFGGENQYLKQQIIILLILLHFNSFYSFKRTLPRFALHFSQVCYGNDKSYCFSKAKSMESFVEKCVSILLNPESFVE